jgi:hypothetical protein
MINPRVSPATPTITNINISIFHKVLRKERDVKKIPALFKEFDKPQFCMFRVAWLFERPLPLS